MALDGAVLTVQLPYSGLAGIPARISKMLSWIQLSTPRALGASPSLNPPIIFPCESTVPRGISTLGRNQKADLTLPFLVSPAPHSMSLWLLLLFPRWSSCLSIIRIISRVIKLLQ